MKAAVPVLEANKHSARYGFLVRSGRLDERSVGAGPGVFITDGNVGWVFLLDFFGGLVEKKRCFFSFCLFSFFS